MQLTPDTKPGKTAAQELAHPKTRIAVVDDDPSFLRAIHRTLRIAGYHVSVFASPGEFLKSVDSYMPHCLVVDMHMPEMSGLELQDRLVANGLCVPAILVTAHDTAQTREHALRVGITHILLKPFESLLLLQAIERSLPVA